MGEHKLSYLLTYLLLTQSHNIYISSFKEFHKKRPLIIKHKNL